MSQSRAWTWRHAIIKSDLPATTRHVLLTISCFMNELGDGCYPTQKQLCDATGLSERAVRDHLQIAEDRGWIKRKEHGFRGQRWRNHEYQAVWPDPQDVGERAAPDAGPSDQGAAPSSERCGTSHQNVRQEVPPTSPDTNPYTSPPSAPERAGEGDFDILWSRWPEGQRPDNRKHAEGLFRRLSPEEKSQALSAFESYSTAMIRRGKPRRMVTYLKERLFIDFVDAPEVDEDGRFRITPKRPEWGAWLGVIRKKYGDDAVQRTVMRGFYLPETRWPPGHSASA